MSHVRPQDVIALPSSSPWLGMKENLLPGDGEMKV